jgi:hypothetical protein
MEIFSSGEIASILASTAVSIFLVLATKGSHGGERCKHHLGGEWPAAHDLPQLNILQASPQLFNYIHN